MTTSLADLLAELAASPNLTGAACRGRHDLFDPVDRDDPRVAEAVRICQTQCPALEACHAWLASTPSTRRPSGVVAGTLIAPPRPRVRAPQPPKPKRPPQPTRADEATAWLAEYLTTHGPTRGSDVLAAAAAAGYKRGVMFAARKALGICVPPRVGAAARRSPIWRLPESQRAQRMEGAMA
ncbi:hypothetical protein BST23_11925 [Mycolicibacterium elephantis]|uniref:4Fe-4S Wbl-type domain-containing protein n=1 Tax=Mycolicibacterium elephantis TaxID=81858 RepID=A0A1X0D1C3_9MYCO|nr:WhiB family transcriptional regulator [Mycolicibacterium elephantis]ORA66029.1 hypothetical protein BST23_11925 [Mycolicibacterium elephantis]